MSLIQEQIAFLRDLRKLYDHADTLGYFITQGEAERLLEMQMLHVKAGRSKTLNSEHLRRCAQDLNIFLMREGKLCLCSREEIKPLGDFWESLSPKNRWGGNWRGLVDAGKSKFVDAPHFERRTV